MTKILQVEKITYCVGLTSKLYIGNLIIKI